MQGLVVAQQMRCFADLSDDNIEIAIAVDVGERRAASDQRLEEIAAAFFGWNYDETTSASLAGVPKQLGRLRVTLAFLNFADLRLQMPVGGEQIQAPVQVIIEEEQAELQQQPAGRSHALSDGLV